MNKKKVKPAAGGFFLTDFFCVNTLNSFARTPFPDLKSAEKINRKLFFLKNRIKKFSTWPFSTEYPVADRRVGGGMLSINPSAGALRTHKTSPGEFPGMVYPDSE